MFAYCLNNSISYSDPGGTNATFARDTRYICMDGTNAAGPTPAGNCCVLVSAGLVIGISAVLETSYARVSYAYRQYVKNLKASASGMLPGNYTVTHHIIPYGEFSLRSEAVIQKLHEAQAIMIRAGVNPASDPINQLVLSATYHMSLHTDAYIIMVTEPIIALGPTPSKEQIYAILYDLRIGIASNDPYAWGY